MSFAAKDLADLMFGYIDRTGTGGGPGGDVSSASTMQKKWIALAMTQGLQEARKLNPGLFVQRPGIVLRAPISGTITVTQYSTAVTLGTLTVPNDGCTVRIADGLDNELNVTGTPGTYELARPHEGASGTLNATLWNDCWMAADGTSFEAVLDDVRAGGRPLEVLTDPDEMDAYRLFNDFGNVAMARVRPAGIVRAVLCEQWASPYVKKIQTRLRFAPMPSAATVVAASLVIAAPTFTTSNVTSTSITFQVPQQIDELLLFPIAMKKFMAMPVFRAPAETRKELDGQYADAVNTLKLLRGHYGAENRIRTQAG